MAGKGSLKSVHMEHKKIYMEHKRKRMQPRALAEGVPAVLNLSAGRVFMYFQSGYLFPINQGIYFQSGYLFPTNQGIYLCRGDPEHPGCEAMHQPRLFLNRQGCSWRKEKSKSFPLWRWKSLTRGKPHQPNLGHLFGQIKPAQKFLFPLCLNTLPGQPGPHPQPGLVSSPNLSLLLLQVNIGILIAVTRVISRISADNYKVHGDANAFK